MAASTEIQVIITNKTPKNLYVTDNGVTKVVQPRTSGAFYDTAITISATDPGTTTLHSAKVSGVING